MQVIQAYHVVSLDMYVGLLTCVLLLSSSSCVEDVVKTKQEKKQSFKGNNRGFCFGNISSKQVSYVARADRRELSTPATSSGGRPDIGVRLDHWAGD